MQGLVTKENLYSMKKCINNLNRAISKEEVQMAKKHMKKCSTYQP
jgi:hypothetical protein